jgi:YHS domain-containing protein
MGRVRIFPICLRALFALACVLACDAGRASEYNHLSLSGVAIEGYDAVAYWEGERPAAGSRSYSLEWQGAVWLFASPAHLARFKAAPERYAPAFGGYCAFAMSKGTKAPIHPFIYEVAGGKLYLFYSFESRDKFLADPSLLHLAEDHWSIVSERMF